MEKKDFENLYKKIDHIVSYIISKENEKIVPKHRIYHLLSDGVIFYLKKYSIFIDLKSFELSKRDLKKLVDDEILNQDLYHTFKDSIYSYVLATPLKDIEISEETFNEIKREWRKTVILNKIEERKSKLYFQTNKEKFKNILKEIIENKKRMLEDTKQEYLKIQETLKNELGNDYLIGLENE
jgi:hypothetical protein